MQQRLQVQGLQGLQAQGLQGLPGVQALGPQHPSAMYGIKDSPLQQQQQQQQKYSEIQRALACLCKSFFLQTSFFFATQIFSWRCKRVLARLRNTLFLLRVFICNKKSLLDNCVHNRRSTTMRSKCSIA
jgi:hypothetical protein